MAETDSEKREHRSSMMSSITQMSSSIRLETFTEAVPLSLSSMAHASVPLEDGVLDGLKQVIQHSLLSCVNYARIVHPPHQWTFRDLTTSPFAWTPVKGHQDPSDLPHALQKLNFKHLYTKSALIYLKPALSPDMTAEGEQEIMKNWGEHVGILGFVSLRYASTEPLTKGEMEGTDVDDVPSCMLYKIVLEYRSIPPTGNQQALQAEELSMLSFGGSIDDNVKYGALASLYDLEAKYVLEIYSVRGKKYKFDLMDSTLSNGTIPQLPASREGDPFVKSLCVTVSDHEMVEPEQNEKKYALTRMHLLLEGKPRKGKDLENLPRFNYITEAIKASFLHLNPDPPLMVTANPSGHALILDPEYAGRIYVNGGFVTTWGVDPRIGSHGTALFGMDLHSVPMWHNRIVNYEDVKLAYGQLWHEVLIDATLFDHKIATKLLYRLIRGHDPDDGDSEYDDDEVLSDTAVDCLESQVLSSGVYDRVGIAPKALATRFGIDFGGDSFPCLSHEVEWVKSMLPDRQPVVVPQRVISVLRRGGYFDTQRTFDDLWFHQSRPPHEGEERDVVQAAIALLEECGCDDVSPEQVSFVSAPPAADVVRMKLVCRYGDPYQMYCVHENFLQAPLVEFLPDSQKSEASDEKLRAYVLGMCIAKEHPDGRVLLRYMMRINPSL